MPRSTQSCNIKTMKPIIIFLYIVLLSSCGEEEYEFPIGEMTCPMEFRLVYSSKHGKKIPDDSKDCEFVFTAKHNLIKSCPSCGTSMNYIRAHHKQMHKMMRQKMKSGDHRITNEDVEEMREVLRDVGR